MPRHEDRSLLEAALVGYESQLSTITTAIADIQKRLGKKRGGVAAAPVGATTPRKKRRISPEGLARIAEGQRKRWAKAKRKSA